MADQNYLYATRQNPFNSFLQGFQGGQQIIGNISQGQMARMKNQMVQNELMKEEATKKALAGYGQEGFDDQKAIQSLMPVNPELAIKIKDTLRKSTKEQIDLLSAGAGIIEKVGPTLLDNPQQYLQVYQTFNHLGLTNLLPHPSTFIGQDGQFNLPVYQQTVKNIVAGKDILKEQLNPVTPHFTQTQDESGNMQVFATDPRTLQTTQVPGITGYKQGMMQEVELPDGTKMRMSTGGKQTPGSTGLQPGTQKLLEEKLLGATDNLRMVKDLIPSMNKEFQTYPGQAKQWLLRQGEKFGIELDDNHKGYIKGYSAFIAKAKNMHSNILKNLSGLAVTAAEEKRIKDFTIDPETDSHTQSIAKLENLQEDLEATIARTNYIRKHGISIKNAPEDIRSIMIATGKRFKQQEIAKGTSKDKINDIVNKKLEDYFFNPAARLGLVE